MSVRKVKDATIIRASLQRLFSAPYNRNGVTIQSFPVDNSAHAKECECPRCKEKTESLRDKYDLR